MDRIIIMSEPPAKCCFGCEYCYIPKNFDRRLDAKRVTGQDYLKLAAKTGGDKFLFWLCGIGEPFMMPYFYEVITTVSQEHKACAVTNLSYFGNNWPEDLCKLPEEQKKNIGMYWSVHWNEMAKHSCTGKTLDRVKKMLDSGIKVWPTLVTHPCYFNGLDKILTEIDKLGVRLSLCRYRIGQEDLAGLQEENQIRKKYANDKRVSFKIWDITPQCWEVAGGKCSAGKKQVIIDAWWRICTCHGDGGSARFFGTFPEDIDRLQLTTPGVCKSSKCPCKHSVFYGVNSKFPHTFVDILDGWENFENA